MSFQDKIRDPDCELCPLHEGAQHVCLMGSGSRKAKIMIVGEAPGAQEDSGGEPFVGPAGQLLDELLASVDIDRDDCYITNVVKCRPPENQTPELKEIKECVSTYLTQELDKIDPDFILTLGNSALRGVTGKSGITKHRGQVYDAGGIPVLAAFHPAYALRNPKNLEPLRSDFRRFSRLVKGLPLDPKHSRLKIIRNKQQLRWLKTTLEAAPEIAFDFETSDRGRKVDKKFRYTQPWDEDGKIICVSFSVKPGVGIVVPLWHDESPFRKNWEDTLRYVCKDALEDTSKRIIAHNGKFDCKWAASRGIFVNLTFDTMLAAHLLDENRLKGLKPLSEMLLDRDAYAIELVDSHTIPLGTMSKYAGKDTDNTLQLYHIFRDQLKQQPRLARIFKFLMMEGSNVLTQVEMLGMYVHDDKLQEQLVAYDKRRLKLEKFMKQYIPVEKRESFNFNSHPQVAQWLFGDLELPIIETTGKGAPSSKESVLLRLASSHDAVKALNKHRGVVKNLGYLRSWDARKDRRNRVHANYKLFGTVTGRLSSEEPNLQQVPRESTMRTVFGAPDGWTFVQADFSQVELRIAAMLSGDRAMNRSYLTGEDLHMKTAVSTTGKRTRDITKEERKKAKAINFGFLYGMGHKKFVEYARDNYDVEVTETEAKHVRDTFFDTFRGLRPWHDRQRRLANRYGQVQSPIGRIRHLTDIQSSDKNIRAEAERQAINSPVQSFASDLMLLAMTRLNDEMPGGQARIVGTVHDSILFEIKNEFLEKWLPIIKSTMEDTQMVKRKFGAIIDIPIVVDIELGNWGEGKEWHL